MSSIITHCDIGVNTIRVSQTSHSVNNHLMETFGRRLKRLRNNVRLTQEKLALACGYSGQSRIANYENDSRLPSLNEIPVLASALGVGEAELFAALPDDSNDKLNGLAWTEVPLDSPFGQGAKPISSGDATLFQSSTLPKRVLVKGAVVIDEKGFWIDLVDVGSAHIDWSSAHDDGYAIEIRSDVFYPEIRRGVYMLFSPTKALAFNEYALVQLKDGRSTVVEFLRHEGGLYTFTSLLDRKRLSLADDEVAAVHAHMGTVPASERKEG